MTRCAADGPLSTAAQSHLDIHPTPAVEDFCYAFGLQDSGGHSAAVAGLAEQDDGFGHVFELFHLEWYFAQRYIAGSFYFVHAEFPGFAYINKGCLGFLEQLNEAHSGRCVYRGFG